MLQVLELWGQGPADGAAFLLRCSPKCGAESIESDGTRAGLGTEAG